MHEDTGEIKAFSSNKPLPEKWRAIGGIPKSSCPHCYGRGYIGRNVTTNKIVICRCIRR